MKISQTGNRKGFTLIEMLIVIAVIGILASAVLIGLGPVQKQARDARRISELRQVQNALELYFNKCGYYPGDDESATPCGARSGVPATWALLTTALTGSSLGINQIPKDPSPNQSYFYVTNGAGTSYILGATLEDANNPNLAQDVDNAEATAANIVMGSNSCDGANFCILF